MELEIVCKMHLHHPGCGHFREDGSEWPYEDDDMVGDWFAYSAPGEPIFYGPEENPWDVKIPEIKRRITLISKTVTKDDERDARIKARTQEKEQVSS